MSSLTFTLIQSRLHWEDKQANLDMFGEKIMDIDVPTEIVVLPEMFSTGFSMKPSRLAEGMDGETVSWMKKVAAAKRVILAGSVIIEENGNYFNRLLWALPDGSLGYYDKRHRFAYAGEDKEYTAGQKRMIAGVKGWKINLQVCYDLRFPVWARQQGNDVHEYDVLLYVANWPEKRVHAWRTLLTARAIENQCYVIGLNRVGDDGNGIYHSGDSMVIDALGNTMYHKQADEDIHTITLQKQPLQEIRERFPFSKDADSFMIKQADEN